jgi:hypothetical protein
MDGTMAKRLRQALSVVLTVYIFVLAGLLLVSGDPGGESGVEWIYLLPVVSAAAMGLFLSWKRPENAIGTLISVIGAALMTLGMQNYLLPKAFEQGQKLTVVALVLVGDAAWIIQFVASLVLLPLWFPTGVAINARWGWVGRVAVIAGMAGWASFLLADHVCAGYESPDSSVCSETVAIPWGIEGFAGLDALLLVAMASAIPAVTSVFIRWHRSRGEERQQLKWVLLALTAVAIGLVLTFDNWNLPEWINIAVNALTLAGLWVAIVVAILRYRLFDIDRIISRTISYALVVGVLTLVMLSLMALFAGFLPSDDPLVVATATLVAAALFSPARRRVQVWIDRRFNRSRYDSARVIEEFTLSLQDRVDPGGVVDDWVGVVVETMQPASVAVWVRGRTK